MKLQRAGSFWSGFPPYRGFGARTPAGGSAGPRLDCQATLSSIERAPRRRYCPERAIRIALILAGLSSVGRLPGRLERTANIYERFLQGRQPNRSSRRTFFIPPRAFRQRESLGGENATHD